MAKVVLDASALLAFVTGEPGGEIVADAIGDAVISTVNFAEAVTKLIDRGASLDGARDVLGIAEYGIVEFDRGQAEATGALIAKTRKRGLSLGDRACLALAQRERIPALTADRGWADLDVGVDVRLFR
jgi:PIN domain nuclease of toxin-antitoxin system